VPNQFFVTTTDLWTNLDRGELLDHHLFPWQLPSSSALASASGVKPYTETKRRRQQQSRRKATADRSSGSHGDLFDAKHAPWGIVTATR